MCETSRPYFKREMVIGSRTAHAYTLPCGDVIEGLEYDSADDMLAAKAAGRYFSRPATLVTFEAWQQAVAWLRAEGAV
jgi:hypothetical protein